MNLLASSSVKGNVVGDRILPIVRQTIAYNRFELVLTGFHWL